VIALPGNGRAKIGVNRPRDKIDGVPSSFVAAGRRGWRTIRAAWPSGAPGYVLLGLLILGVGLRLVAIVSWWPTTNTLDDGYQLYAGNPFEDPQHPAGYGLLIGALGHLTREVAVLVLIQHAIGIGSALLLFAATRRVTGSQWAGLLPAAFLLLNPDLIFLEHAIMSESWAVLATSIGLYAAARSFDEPQPWWRWPALTGLALAVGTTVRTAGLLAIPVAVLALLLCRPGPLRNWRTSWRAPAAAAAAAAVVLVGYATANATFGEGFAVGPSSAWYLYGRAAQFADCSRFDPPPGTNVLCERKPAGERPGDSYYLFDQTAPAPRYFGSFGHHDEPLKKWAQRAIRAQPLDFADTAWMYLRWYYFPGSRPPGKGADLDPSLDFTWDNPFFASTIQANLERYFNDFTPSSYRPGLQFLRAWHHVTRFGATALFVTTVLTLIGLVIGTRRSRVGVMLFGVGGLALLVAPVLTGNYIGRYLVPLTGPLMAAAAITITKLWRGLKSREANSAKGRRFSESRS
jgi:4-amino-4-deoxy-L-arabinose transferase-like glycosyltransferase